MELTQALEKIVSENMYPIQHRLVTMGYEIKSPLQKNVQSANRVNESVTIELFHPELEIHCGVSAYWSFPRGSWDLNMVLMKPYASCNLEVLMPKLQIHNDPSVLTFKHHDNIEVLDARMKKAVQVLLEIMASSEFEPILSGKKWVDAKLPLPDEYF